MMSIRTWDSEDKNNLHAVRKNVLFLFLRVKILANRQVWYRLLHCRIPVSYTHLTLPTNREV